MSSVSKFVYKMVGMAYDAVMKSATGVEKLTRHNIFRGDYAEKVEYESELKLRKAQTSYNNAQELARQQHEDRLARMRAEQRNASTEGKTGLASSSNAAGLGVSRAALGIEHEPLGVYREEGNNLGNEGLREGNRLRRRRI